MASFATTKSNFFRAKGTTFEKQVIIDAVGKAQAAVMSRQGSLVRGIARKSMHKAKKPSKAPNPPNVHTGLLKKLIFFAYDPKTYSVVCGPVKFNAKGVDVPHVLEYGGEAIVRDRAIINRKGQAVPLKFMKPAAREAAIRSGKAVTVERKITIEARPYMAPALEKSIPYLAKEWKGAVKK
jgi:hypothetical protein